MEGVHCTKPETVQCTISVYIVQRDFRWRAYIAQSLRLREGLQAKLLQQHSNNRCLPPQLTLLRPLPAEIGCSIHGNISEAVFGKRHDVGKA